MNFVNPLISAVMLTGKDPSREAFCAMAVRCFRAQTWARKELVVVNHGEYHVNADMSPDIHEVHIKRHNMGLMRQALLEEAKGDIIIQWDDDDISMPDRMRIQAEPIMARRVEATFLGSQLRYSLQSNTALVGWNARNPGIDGTVCHIADPKYRYQDVAAREDSIFRQQFKKTEVIQGDRLHIRLHHGGNIMAEKFIMYDLTGKRNIWRLDTAHDRMLLTALERYLQIKVPVHGHTRVTPYVLPQDKIGKRVF